MTIDNKDTFEVTFTSLAHGGEGFGRLPDGRAVFVPFVLPQETARIHLTEEKRGFARGALVEILDSSPQRIAPRCPHFTVCGGCHLQHLDYPGQVAAKADVLADQLRRIGKLEDPPISAPIPCPAPWNYRNHIQFHLTPEGTLGFLAAGSHQVIPVTECHLPDLSINAIWPQLSLEAGTGLEKVSFRSGAGDDIMLILESGEGVPPPFSLDLPLSAVYMGAEGPVVLSGDHRLVVEVLEREFQVSAPSFFQVNTAMAARLVEHLLAQAPITPQSVVLDVYCGAGLFSAFLAERAGRVVGIESSPSACEDFIANLDEFDNVELYEDQAENTLATLDLQPDIAVVDPPRSGLHRHALDGLLRLAPDTLLYVSCDPATLARDAQRLTSGGYYLVQVTPFDLFPQTYHLESVSVWVRAK